MDSKKRERDIADWIGRPYKPPSRNEDEEAEGKEEDVGATQASTEDKSLIKEYEEGREFDWEDDRKDTGLWDEKKRGRSFIESRRQIVVVGFVGF